MSQGRLHFWSCVYVWSGISIHLLWEYIASEYQLTRSFDHNIETGTRGTDAFLRPRKRSASFIYPLCISPSTVYDIIYLSFSLFLAKILPSGRINDQIRRVISGALCRRSWVKRTSRDIPRPTAQRKPSLYLCLSLFLSLFAAPRNVRPLKLLYGRMPCRELNDRVARRDGFLRGAWFRNADELAGVARGSRGLSRLLLCCIAVTSLNTFDTWRDMNLINEENIFKKLDVLCRSRKINRFRIHITCIFL